jgi:5,6-dimethylbenzimidazole synthase
MTAPAARASCPADETRRLLDMTDSLVHPCPDFDTAFRSRLLDLFRWRRDVRHFRPDPVDPALLDRLLEIACLAPSVGLSQPWRFVTVDDLARRAAVRDNFARSNAEALASQSDDHAAHYARLKLAGLDQAPCHFAVFAERDPEQGHGLGRRTMPETTAYSAVMAVYTIWLAARAEGLGLGWVSILDPADIVATLDVPADWTFIGYFCLGYPRAETEIPELERLGWEHRRGAKPARLQR